VKIDHIFDEVLKFRNLVAYFYCSIMYIHHEPIKKGDTILLTALLSDIDDFKNSFTDTLSRKFTTNQSLEIPPHLKRAATLPCEI